MGRFGQSNAISVLARSGQDSITELYFVFFAVATRSNRTRWYSPSFSQRC